MFNNSRDSFISPQESDFNFIGLKVEEGGGVMRKIKTEPGQYQGIKTLFKFLKTTSIEVVFVFNLMQPHILFDKKQKKCKI